VHLTREAEVLTGRSVSTPADMADAARALVDLGARAALVKGGHLTVGSAGRLADEAFDVFCDGRNVTEFSVARVPIPNTHGSGCTLSAAVVAGLACCAEPRLRAAGIRFPDVLYGLHQTGAIDESYVTALIQSLRPGTTELYCHPGVMPDPEVKRRMPGYQHETELAALCAPRVRQSLYGRGVTLFNYWQLREG